MKNDDANDTANEGAGKTLTVALIGVTVAWAANIWFAWPSEPGEGSNTLGDSLNGVGALFNGCALAAVAVSLHYQRKDFSATLREMRDTRGEMRDNRIEMEEARKEQVRQINATHLSTLSTLAGAELGAAIARYEFESLQAEKLRKEVLDVDANAERARDYMTRTAEGEPLSKEDTMSEHSAKEWDRQANVTRTELGEVTNSLDLAGKLGMQSQKRIEHLRDAIEKHAPALHDYAAEKKKVEDIKLSRDYSTGAE